MKKLTAKNIENAISRSKEYKLHDGEGLFLRIRSSGVKSWLFSFSLPGDRRLIRMTLGSVDRISLKEEIVKLTNVVPFLLEDKLKSQGGIYEKSSPWEIHVTVDQRLITGQNPQSAKAVGEAMKVALSK